jgi:pimeloyl-ACP methyl ester carboxylesterase
VVSRRSRRGVECATEEGPAIAAALRDQVRDALRHLHDPAYLERHALAARIGVGDRARGAGWALRAELVGSVEALRPERGDPDDGHGWRSYRILRRQYVDGVAPGAVLAELAVSKSEYFRDQRRAIDAICGLLQTRWVRGPDGGAAATAASGDRTPGGRFVAAPGSVWVPETRYARSGDVNIAYNVVGDGPLDLVFVMGWLSHIELMWHEPSFARFLRRLASFSRLITFDKRGTGLSDRVAESRLPNLEQRMDDVRAVMDAVGSERAALLGVSEGGPLSVLFAATYPERTAGLVLYGAMARRLRADDYPWGPTDEEFADLVARTRDNWEKRWDLQGRAPSAAHTEAYQDWFDTWRRTSASPGAVATLMRMNGEIDVRAVLPTIRVPTLVVHRTDDMTVPVEGGRHLAAHVPGARYVELSGIDHMPFLGEIDTMLDHIEAFLTGAGRAVDRDGVLATVMLAEVADSVATDLISRLRARASQEVRRFRGREVSTTEDRVFATFDGPARAIRCARAIVEAGVGIGLDVRAGLHTGECELGGGRVTGVAVQIAERVAAAAARGEVVVSSTVRELVAGSGLSFVDRGSTVVEGVPGRWRLFRVEPANGRATALDA